jgi:hypothetical protein
MEYAITYFSEAVQEQILNLPDTLAARYIVLTRRMIAVGPNLGDPRRELDIAAARLKEIKHANP